MPVAYANFNSNNRQANFNYNNPNNENDNIRGRASERVYLLLAVGRSKPSSEHSSDFSQFCLLLKNSSFINKFKLQKQPYFHCYNLQ